MKMKDCDKIISYMKSVNDMKFWFGYLRDKANICNELTTRNVYDAALFYLNTCRLSGSCELSIFENVRKVVKNLNRRKSADYDEIGTYLKSFGEVS